MATSRITELAQIIARDTAIVEDFCSKNKLPSPSFDYNAPPTVDIPPTEPAVSAAKDNVVAATHELGLLMRGPIQVFTDIGFIDAFVFQAISRLGIAEKFPVGEEISFEELSRKCGIAEVDLRRVLRFAMTDGFFAEHHPGYVAHTSLSRMLADNGLYRNAFAFTMEENFSASAKATDALLKHPFSQEPTLSGWGLAHQAKEPMFQELQKHYPVRHSAASSAMDAWDTFIPAAPLRDNYLWADTKTVVDIGGGRGPVSVALAQHAQQTKFVVQDLADVVANATVPAEVQDRITFMEHDMFKEQPVKNADVYFFRSVFHDWPDKYCVKILKALIPALKPGARVLINDACMPPSGALPPAANRAKRIWDMNMMLLFNGLDREEADWAQLFHKADPRFKFLGVRMPTKNVEGVPPAFLLNIIEAVWEP